jgi:hypothetical protein
MIKINLDKAKEITKDRLRQERVPLLEENDKQYIIAIKDGLDIDPLMEERQRLLDITQLADAALTVEELKEITV